MTLDIVIITGLPYEPGSNSAGVGSARTLSKNALLNIPAEFMNQETPPDDTIYRITRHDNSVLHHSSMTNLLEMKKTEFANIIIFFQL